MSRKSRRTVAIAIAGVCAVAPMVSACAAGRNPQTALPTQLVEGVNASVQQIGIRDMFVLGPEAGQRLAAGGAAPVYAGIVNNASVADRLVAVEAPGVAQSVEIAGGSLTIPPHTLIFMNRVAATASASAVPTPGTSVSATPSTGTPAPGRPKKTGKPAAGTTPSGGAPTAGAPATQAPAPNVSAVILRGLTKDLLGGETIRMTFHFERAGTITANVPVEPRQGYYSTYSPVLAASSPAPTGQATPGASTSPGTTPGGTPKSRKPKQPTPAPSA